MLLIGANLLDRLPVSRQAPLPPECGLPLCGARIDPAKKTVDYWCCLPQYSWVLPLVRSAWPGWTVRQNDAIFREHIRTFESRYVPPEDEEVLAELVGQLEAYDFIDYHHQADDPAQLPKLPSAEQRRALVALAVEESRRV